MLQATAPGLARIAEAAGTREVPMTDEAAAFAAGSKAFASQRQDVGTSDAPTVVTATTEANPPPLATTAEAASTGEAASNLRPTLRRRPSCAHTSQRSGYSPADRASPARRLGRSHQPRERQHWRLGWSVYCPSRCPGRTRSGPPARVLASRRTPGRRRSSPCFVARGRWAGHRTRSRHKVSTIPRRTALPGGAKRILPPSTNFRGRMRGGMARLSIAQSFDRPPGALPPSLGAAVSSISPQASCRTSSRSRGVQESAGIS
jgi:hypothetical protein